LRAADNEQAKHFFHEALSRNAGMAEAQFGLAKIYLAEGRYKEALAAIDDALRLGSDVQSAHYLRGRILTKLGRREEAQKEMMIASRMADAQGARGQDAFDDDRVPNQELAQPPQ
jgi:tetratricopeptide (TPR) repeat protein